MKANYHNRWSYTNVVFDLPADVLTTAAAAALITSPALPEEFSTALVYKWTGWSVKLDTRYARTLIYTKNQTIIYCAQFREQENFTQPSYYC